MCTFILIRIIRHLITWYQPELDSIVKPTSLSNQPFSLMVFSQNFFLYFSEVASTTGGQQHRQVTGIEIRQIVLPRSLTICAEA